MGIIKSDKKKLSFKRIGYAVVPPAAFTVVPNYTFPKPLGQKTKGINRFAASSSAIAGSIALPQAHEHLNDSDSWSFNSVPEDEPLQATRSPKSQSMAPSAGRSRKSKALKGISKTALTEAGPGDKKRVTLMEEVTGAKSNTSLGKYSKFEDNTSRRSSWNDQDCEEGPRRRPTEQGYSRGSSRKSSLRQRTMDEQDTALMRSAAILLDDEGDLGETLLKLMQKLVDKKSSARLSDDQADSVIDGEADANLDERRRRKRRKLRKLKGLVDTKSITSLEGAAFESEDDCNTSQGGRRAAEEKRIKRRRSVKRLKDRVARSSITSLEEEFGSQLTLDADGVKMAQRGRHRRTRKPNHVAAEETSSTRFNIVEESLQRALSELHYFQIQYGSHSEIRQKAELLAQEHRIPEWLTDPEELSPLFKSYDLKIKKMEEEIKMLQESGGNAGGGDGKERGFDAETIDDTLNNLRQENSRLLSKCHEFSLQVVSLQEKLEKEMQDNSESVRTLKTLKKDLESVLADQAASEKENDKNREEMRELRSTVSRLEQEIEMRIPKTIHEVQLKGVRTEVEEVKDRHAVEINNYKAMLKTAQIEQANSQLEAASVATRLTAAEAEIHSLHEHRSKAFSEMDILRQRNNSLLDQYEVGQAHLSNTIRVAERALLERSTFAELAEREQRVSKNALNQSMKEKLEMGRMEESLKQVRTLLANQTHDINNQLRDHEESQQTQTMKLEREIKHLRQKIHEKDGTIEQMKVQQRRTEIELEAVCESAANETNLMMKNLHASYSQESIEL